MKMGKICVIGLTGQSAFFAAEHFPHPGETVSCHSLFFEPGGKGHNQAVACARMGAETVFVSGVGNDTNGMECEKALTKENITTCLIHKNIPTAFAAITINQDSENIVEVFGGAAKAIQPEDLFQERIKSEIKDCEYLLLQNELPVSVLDASLQLAEESGMKIIFNPAPAEHISMELLARCDVITPNLGEAKQIAGFATDEDPSDQELAEFFRKNYLKNVAVTLGTEGVLLVTGDGCKRIPAYRYGKAVDTTGAGDTFNGVMTAALADGSSLEAAIEIAVIAAGISVTREGAVASIPTKREVEACRKVYHESVSMSESA